MIILYWLFVVYIVKEKFPLWNEFKFGTRRILIKYDVSRIIYLLKNVQFSKILI